MTVEEFESALSDAVEGMRDLQPILTQIGGDIVKDLKENENLPVDTGRLRNSIKAVIGQDSLKIEMLYYGLFQNYGVSTPDNPGIGIPVEKAFGLSEDIRPATGWGTPYSFTGGKFGIRPKSFMDAEAIAIRIREAVEQQIQEQF